MNKKLVGVLAGLIFLGVIGWSSLGRSGVVTIFIYSGRENPQWTVNADGLTEMQGILGTLPESAVDIEDVGMKGFLGYSGIEVTTFPAQSIFVKGADVYVSKLIGKDILYADDGHLLENWLLENFESQTDVNEYQSIRGGVNSYSQ